MDTRRIRFGRYYLVTTGRFRQFVAAWSGGWETSAGSGKHTHVNGGNGLFAVAGGGLNWRAMGYETGWAVADNSNIAPTHSNLACDPFYATWTTTGGTHETLPINCVNWWEAYAFCIWDGAFLPSEAEWEYAAAGGDQQREYPWGSADPGSNNAYAIYGCCYASTTTRGSSPTWTIPRWA